MFKSKLLFIAVSIIALLIRLTTKWLTNNLGVKTVDYLIFTILAPLNGADYYFVIEYIKSVIPSILLLVVIETIIFIIIKKQMSKTKYIIIWSVNLIFVLNSLMYMDSMLNVIGYFKTTKAKTNVYSENTEYNPVIYVDPYEVDIKGENTNNLIFIYLESVENSFTSVELGGNIDTNCIKELTDLALHNISFSNNEKIGGPLNLNGSTWTIASLVSQTAGIPLKGTAGNSMNVVTNFMPGAKSIGDILEDNNYIQEYFIGQDTEFAGTDKYLLQHGNYKLFNIQSFKEMYEIPEEAICGWGIKDYFLFDKAKEELTKIANAAKENNQKFNFTIATIDCHMPEGVKCPMCPDIYEDSYRNIIACQSALVGKFIDWCKNQSWFYDTTIIISGDHPAMISQEKLGIDNAYQRTTYNCIINSKITSTNFKNRQFSRMDLFPTTLAAMGFKIDGDKLGVGTNLFSNEKTCIEQYGFDFINNEINKSDKQFEKKIYGFSF